MTLEERVEAMQKEFDIAAQQVSEWSARRLRAEGALAVLRQLHDEARMEEAHKEETGTTEG